MSRNVLKHTKLLDAVTINNSLSSDKINVENLDKASIDINWSAGSSPVGVITIESTNNSDVDINQGLETWHSLDFSAVINITGNSGSHQIIFDSMPFRFIKIVYTRTSGSAVMSAIFHANTVGA